MHPQHDVEAGRLVPEMLLDEPLVRVPNKSNDHGTSLLTTISFLFLTYNTGMAVYRSNGDYGAISFAAFSYADFVLLFYCLRPLERAAPSSPERERVKMAVWILTTLLAGMFAAGVAAIMPPAVAGIVCAMAVTAVVGVYYAFFLRLEQG